MALYQKIVEDIQEQIRTRRLTPGDRIPSIGEMCEYYGVSTITAKSALSALQHRGLIKSMRGKGSFVTGMPAADVDAKSQAPLRKITLLTADLGLPHSRSFLLDLWGDIEQATRARGMDFQIQTVVRGGAVFPVDLAFQARADEGLIFLMPSISPQIVSLMQNKNLRSVWLDSLYSCVHCVLTDNIGGVRQIVDHLQSLKHERFLLVYSHPMASNPANENERLSAFQFLMEDRGLHGEVMAYDGESSILRRLKKPGPPTAILFMQDEPAIQFVREARNKGIRVPQDISVTGFDDWARADADLQELTTLHVDRLGLAQKAVEVLCDPAYHARLFAQWFRVPGTLVERVTTGVALHASRPTAKSR